MPDEAPPLSARDPQSSMHGSTVRFTILVSLIAAANLIFVPVMLMRGTFWVWLPVLSAPLIWSLWWDYKKPSRGGWLGNSSAFYKAQSDLRDADIAAPHRPHADHSYDPDAGPNRPRRQ